MEHLDDQEQSQRYRQLTGLPRRRRVHSGEPTPFEFEQTPAIRMFTLVRMPPIRAYLFTIFSLSALFLWPLKPDLCPFMPFTPTVWFACIGMLALSLSRFRGLQHAVPAPELYIFAYAFLLSLFINHLPYQIHTVDKHLFSFEYNFGYSGMIVGKLFKGSKFFGVLLGLTYNSLMFAITAIYLALPGLQVRRKFVAAVILAGIVILPLYTICPGAGPKALLEGNFPSWIPNLSGPPATVVMPTMNPDPAGINAIPSGHFAWALLMFWFVRKHCSMGVQVAAGVYAALTSLATLGTGEHYVVDLILSFPFAAGVWALIHRHWRLAGIALAVVLTWLVALREGWALAIPPLAVWFLTGITLGPLTLYLVGRDLPILVAPDFGRFPGNLHPNPAGTSEQSEGCRG